MARGSIRLPLVCLVAVVSLWLAGAGAAAAATVATGPATSVTGSSAELNGVVDPSKPDSGWLFQYSASSRFKRDTRSTPAVPVSGPVAVSRLISGLSAGVTFYFRIVLRRGPAPAKAGNETIGSTAQFTTLGSAGSGELSLRRSIAFSREGVAVVKLRCLGAFGAPCVVHLRLTHIQRSGRTVTCAAASVATRAPTASSASMRLSGLCRRILAASRQHRLGAKLHLSSAGGQTALTRTLTIVG